MSLYLCTSDSSFGFSVNTTWGWGFGVYSSGDPYVAALPALSAPQFVPGAAPMRHSGSSGNVVVPETPQARRPPAVSMEPTAPSPQPSTGIPHTLAASPVPVAAVASPLAAAGVASPVEAAPTATAVPPVPPANIRKRKRGIETNAKQTLKSMRKDGGHGHKLKAIISIADGCAAAEAELGLRSLKELRASREATRLEYEQSIPTIAQWTAEPCYEGELKMKRQQDMWQLQQEQLSLQVNRSFPIVEEMKKGKAQREGFADTSASFSSLTANENYNIKQSIHVCKVVSVSLMPLLSFVVKLVYFINLSVQPYLCI